MAKFELPVHNAAGTEIEKVHKRDFMPVSLYIKFQKLNEKLANDKIKDDFEMFAQFKPLFCELFPELTADEYDNRLDVAEVIQIFGNIINKATTINTGDSKNA